MFPPQDLNQLHRIDWFDGLLVTGAHLSHADTRCDRLLQFCLQAMADQPGIVWAADAPADTAGVVAIRQHLQAEVGHTIKLDLVRPFVALTPSGALVLAVTDERTRVWGGGSGFSLAVPDSVLQRDRELYICVSEDRDGFQTIEQELPDKQTIQLRRPQLRAVAARKTDLLSGDNIGNSGHIAVARLLIDEGSYQVDQQYVPPLLRLGTAAAFDRELVPRIVGAHAKLVALLYDSIERVGSEFAKGSVTASLMSRRSDYEVLRALMLLFSGPITNIDRHSPWSLLNTVAQPLANWWLAHQHRHFPAATQLSATALIRRASSASERLLACGQRELAAGSSDSLRDLCELFEGIDHAIRTAG